MSDVQEFIDARSLSALQILLLGRWFLIVAVDGFGTAAIGFIAPALYSPALPHFLTRGSPKQCLPALDHNKIF